MTAQTATVRHSRKQKLILYLVIGLMAASTMGMMTLMQSPDFATQLFVTEQCQGTELPNKDLVNDVTAVPPCWLIP